MTVYDCDVVDMIIVFRQRLILELCSWWRERDDDDAVDHMNHRQAPSASRQSLDLQV